MLESLIQHKIKCFRAGGFAIEPFSYIKSAFEISGLKYDFSVLPGMMLLGSDLFEYNYTSVKTTTYYPFSDDVKISNPKGLFFEIPVSTYSHNPFYTILKRILSSEKNEIYGDGSGIYMNAKLDTYQYSLYRLLHLSKTILSLDNTNHYFFKFLMNTHFRYVKLPVVVSHPKTLSDQALLNLAYLVENYYTIGSTDLEKVIERYIIPKSTTT